MDEVIAAHFEDMGNNMKLHCTVCSSSTEGCATEVCVSNRGEIIPDYG
jgi:hypothetical protein